MLKIGDLISKFKKAAVPTKTEQPQNEGEAQSTKRVRNWHEERYDNITVQRYLSFVLLLVLSCLAIISIVVVAYVVNTKRFDPFCNSNR